MKWSYIQTFDQPHQVDLLCIQYILEHSPLQILEQKYGNLYHKILKKLAPCLVLKTRLRNGYHKIARVVFVRHRQPKLDLSKSFTKSCNAWLIEESYKLRQTCFLWLLDDTRHLKVNFYPDSKFDVSVNPNIKQFFYWNP